MAGLSKDAPSPTEIKLHQTSRVLEIAFSDGKRFKLPYEFLRVYSPSAEVRGHGPGQEVLQVGKGLSVVHTAFRRLIVPADNPGASRPSRALKRLREIAGRETLQIQSRQQLFQRLGRRYGGSSAELKRSCPARSRTRGACTGTSPRPVWIVRSGK